MFNEYQSVRLRHPVAPLEINAVGTVVMVHDFAVPVGYEVEFVDADGTTTALLTLRDEDLIAAE